LKAARWEGASSSNIVLKLNSVASVGLVVRGPVGNLNDFDVVWKGQVPVPLTGKDDLYSLPIPKAAIFGTQKFVLALSSYGSINKLEYSTTGASDVADSVSAVGGAVAGALKKETTAQQASDIQAKADSIYQQQRLTVCEADPIKCSGK
jgi:hypothetical protein